MRIEAAKLKHGDEFEADGERYRVVADGELIRFERIPSRSEVIDAFGYGPGRLAEVMRHYWRLE